MGLDFLLGWHEELGLLIANSALAWLALDANSKQISPCTVVSPGAKVLLPLCTATPSKPPWPGVCCCKVVLQSVVAEQEPLLCTTATQWTVPSGLHERLTLVTDRLHTLQPFGVGVLVPV